MVSVALIGILRFAGKHSFHFHFQSFLKFASTLQPAVTKRLITVSVNVGPPIRGGMPVIIGVKRRKEGVK